MGVWVYMKESKRERKRTIDKNINSKTNLQNQDEDSTDDPLAAAIENDFEDFFENRHYDDSFRNYWAV